MSVHYDDGQACFYLGDMRDVLRELPAESVQMCVTSPPYWSLRDYGVEPSVWPNAAHRECGEWDEPLCLCQMCALGGHEWGETVTQQRGGAYATKTRWQHIAGEANEEGVPVRTLNPEAWGLTDGHPAIESGAFCQRCGAWRGALGLEPTPDLFVAHTVEVFREVRRVLAKDGVLFLNIGDSYAAAGGSGTGGNYARINRSYQQHNVRPGGARRAASYGTPDKGRSSSPDHGCFCRSLCGGCREAYRLGRSHTAHSPVPTLGPSLFAPTRERSEVSSGHLPTSDSDRLGDQHEVAMLDQPQMPAPADEQPHASRATILDGSSLRSPASHLAVSSQDDGCPLCGRSLQHFAQVSVRTEECICDSAQHESEFRSLDMDASDSAHPDYTTTALKPKDLVGIPWMVAFALRADGWWLRQDIIWHKPNPMPESVRDRCTKAHEYVFLLSKSERYYYDAEAVSETAIRAGERPRGGVKWSSTELTPVGGIQHLATLGEKPVAPERNKRSVWTIPTAPFPEAHFATFPPALVEPCILAGSREGDTVLDPFLGSGTTALVAKRLGRRVMGIDLNPEYLEMARRRCAQLALIG